MCITGMKGGRDWEGEGCEGNGKGRGVVGGSGSCDSELSFITSFFFLTTVQFVLKKLNP